MAAIKDLTFCSYNANNFDTVKYESVKEIFPKCDSFYYKKHGLQKMNLSEDSKMNFQIVNVYQQAKWI